MLKENLVTVTVENAVSVLRFEKPKIDEIGTYTCTSGEKSLTFTSYSEFGYAFVFFKRFAMEIADGSLTGATEPPGGVSVYSWTSRDIPSSPKYSKEKKLLHLLLRLCSISSHATLPLRFEFYVKSCCVDLWSSLNETFNGDSLLDSGTIHHQVSSLGQRGGG